VWLFHSIRPINSHLKKKKLKIFLVLTQMNHFINSLRRKATSHTTKAVKAKKTNRETRKQKEKRRQDNRKKTPADQ
jgi:hypothetical protein